MKNNFNKEFENIISEGFFKKFTQSFSSDKSKRHQLIKEFNKFCKEYGFTNGKNEANPNGKVNVFVKVSGNGEDYVKIVRDTGFLTNSEAFALKLKVKGNQETAGFVKIESSDSTSEIYEKIEDALEAAFPDAEERFTLNDKNFNQFGVNNDDDDDDDEETYNFGDDGDSDEPINRNSSRNENNRNSSRNENNRNSKNSTQNNSRNNNDSIDSFENDNDTSKNSNSPNSLNSNNNSESFDDDFDEKAKRKKIIKNRKSTISFLKKAGFEQVSNSEYEKKLDNDYIANLSIKGSFMESKKSFSDIYLNLLNEAIGDTAVPVLTVTSPEGKEKKKQVLWSILDSKSEFVKIIEKMVASFGDKISAKDEKKLEAAADSTDAANPPENDKAPDEPSQPSQPSNNETTENPDENKNDSSDDKSKECFDFVEKIGFVKDDTKENVFTYKLDDENSLFIDLSKIGNNIKAESINDIYYNLIIEQEEALIKIGFTSNVNGSFKTGINDISISMLLNPDILISSLNSLVKDSDKFDKIPDELENLIKTGNSSNNESKKKSRKITKKNSKNKKSLDEIKNKLDEKIAEREELKKAKKDAKTKTEKNNFDRKINTVSKAISRARKKLKG